MVFATAKLVTRKVVASEITGHSTSDGSSLDRTPVKVLVLATARLGT